MRDFLIVVVLLLIGAGWAFLVGHSHAVKMRYNCGVVVPWYEAIFLDAEKCPSNPPQ